AFNSKGVDKINCVSNEVFHYDLYDIDLEPNLNAVTYHNGKIYSGTNNGILVFRTYNDHLDSVKPGAVIKALQINYKPFPIDSITEYSYKQNNIAIAFDGVWLKAPDKLSFRYKLKGFDADWLYADEGKLVNYNNLEPGDYTFIVESKNEEDVWSNPVQQQFIILTPVWKRWWFWIFALAIGFAGVYLFIRYRLRNLQRENLLLEQRVAERTSEIEEQSKIIEEKNKTLEQLSLVASKTDNGVLILNAEGKPEYVNESFILRNEFAEKDLETFYLSNIYQFSHSNEIANLIKDAVENKKSVHYETKTKITSTNQDRWESSTLTPIFDEKGDLRKMIVIDTDITEIKKQERIIIQKNKDITDSISYAKKIQHAILPREAVIKSKLPNSFVLYITKDIVSGDFYWFVHFSEFSIIAAVDCTGHGVPGAFMSIIGYSLLNRIINEKKITDPSEILLELNNGVLEILHKKDSESNDGMDLAICKINHTQKTLEFAGAMRPLWIVNNGELTEIKGDKTPIGTRQKERDEPIRYTTHTMPIKEGDHFYMFTDGYCDQFGGVDNRKYSTGRLKTFLLANQQLSFSQLERKLREEHLQWKGKNFQVDDILLIGFTA
ncbi:MAG: SpoIIE family protein phosphatase, partial [Bacteroidia bacterium]|nr:SpoIIE family protein phosphatase [Bacteroidia bacterium]